MDQLPKAVGSPCCFKLSLLSASDTNEQTTQQTNATIHQKHTSKNTPLDLHRMPLNEVASSEKMLSRRTLSKLEKNGGNGGKATKKGYILGKNNARGGGATAKRPPRNGGKMEMTVQKMAIYRHKFLPPFSPLKRRKWLFYVT